MKARNENVVFDSMTTLDLVNMKTVTGKACTVMKAAMSTAGATFNKSLRATFEKCEVDQ